MATAKLHRSQSSANGKKFTVSCWVKQHSMINSGGVWQFNTDAQNSLGLYSNPTVKLRAFISGNYNSGDQTTAYKARDPSGWIHYVSTFDTANADATLRNRLWINGELITSGSKTNAPQDTTYQPVVSGTFEINKYDQQTSYSDHSYSHIHYCDGYAYEASSFGSTDTTSGIWKPNTSPSVSYGTNGVFLKFENSGAMGTDSSGNSNNMTVTGTVTQMNDSPSNVFATLNPLAGNCTFSNGNNTWVGTQSGYEHSSATLGASSNKYYWEVKPNGACGAMGITDPTWQFNRRGSIVYASSSQAYIYEGNGYVSHDSYGDIASNYSSYTSSDIIGVALDLDNNKLYFHKNGTYENSGVPTSGSTGTGAISIQAPSTLSTGFYTPLVADLCSATTGGGDCNFGNGYFGTTAVSSAGTNASGIGTFEYDVPTGYTALSTKGLNE